MCGSYANLEGGSAMWAMRAMTGDTARAFKMKDEDSLWHRWDLHVTYDRNKPGSKKRDHVLKHHYYDENNTQAETHGNEEMFNILRTYFEKGAILSVSGCREGYSDIGLIPGHAYSILNVYRCRGGFMMDKTIRLVQIRNPWGRTNWNGPWSDSSDEWKAHPFIKAELIGNKKEDDGSFFMCWDDFIKVWKTIGVVDRTVDIDALQLDTKEHYGARLMDYVRWYLPFTWPLWAVYKVLQCFGPCCGLLQGAFNFFILCLGCARLYHPIHTNHMTPPPEKDQQTRLHLYRVFNPRFKLFQHPRFVAFYGAIVLLLMALILGPLCIYKVDYPVQPAPGQAHGFEHGPYSPEAGPCLRVQCWEGFIKRLFVCPWSWDNFNCCCIFGLQKCGGQRWRRAFCRRQFNKVKTFLGRRSSQPTSPAGGGGDGAQPLYS